MAISYEDFRERNAVMNLLSNYDSIVKNILFDVSKKFSKLLNSIINDNIDRYLTYTVRTKKAPSLERKLWTKLKDREPKEILKKTVEEAFRDIRDLVAGRVEVRYYNGIPDDVDNLRKLLTQGGVDADLTDEFDDDIYLDHDKRGYRGYHFYVRMDKDAGRMENTAITELQVLTSLQLVWARTIHPLVYDPFKGDDIPEAIDNMTQGVSHTVHSADLQFVTLRDYMYKNHKDKIDLAKSQTGG